MSTWPQPVARLLEILDGLGDHTGELDDVSAWPTKSLRLLDEAGVLGWVIPRIYGGEEFSGSALIEGYLNLARACLPTTFVLTQRNAACQRFALSENEPLKQELLPALTDSDRFATVGISHLTTSRQHLAKPVVAVEIVDGGFRLDGVVPWVTGAAFADWVLLGGTCDDGRQVLVALPMDSEGVSVLAAESLLALDASQTVPIQLEHVFVDQSRLVAGPVEAVMNSGGRGGTGSLGTSALAMGSGAASLDGLVRETQRRPELEKILQPLIAEQDAIVADLLAASGEQVSSTDPVFSNESLRQRSNSFVLRASQAYLAATKGAGFTSTHPASRAVREAMFFLVWSCPQVVVDAQLREFAGVADC
ncbi:MAG: isovaleryl-CoA dehydrogenase [Planctomycetaceae bacterium]|nr:isovaleryl-CoA dehydrogenase [Planctomycetaceae bacterium]